MKKVTTISLAGRAFQVEERAYSAVRDYLEKARRALSKDPDQDEIMIDLEQSIADKCAASLVNGTTVVSDNVMEKALEALGPVESAEDDVVEHESVANDRQRRRLFLIKDGAMAAGVCKGLAVYFNVDVTIVRLLTVLLVFLTHGAMILVYVVLALVLPKADDSEKLAAAYGYGATAREVVDRARQRATDPKTLDGIGRGLTMVWRIFFKFCAYMAVAGAVASTIAYGVGLWAIGLGRTQLSGSLAEYNGLPQWLGLTAFYLSICIVCVLFARVFDRWAMRKASTRATNTAEVSLVLIWVVAVVSTISLITFIGADFRSYAHKHKGYIDIGKGHLCVTDACSVHYNTCDPAVDAHPGWCIGPNYVEPTNANPTQGVPTDRG
jgi:phage shock protein PspC (stress-responsive transcriptional regulator)